jgi:hypothetical protein
MGLSLVAGAGATSGRAVGAGRKSPTTLSFDRAAASGAATPKDASASINTRYRAILFPQEIEICGTVSHEAFQRWRRKARHHAWKSLSEKFPH